MLYQFSHRESMILGIRNFYRWEYSICIRGVLKNDKQMISRIYIYIYIRNRWYFECTKERNVHPNLHDLELNYSICWIRVYIYRFWWCSITYFIWWSMKFNSFNYFLLTYSSKKVISMVSLACWNILSVDFMYISIYI